MADIKQTSIKCQENKVHDLGSRNRLNQILSNQKIVIGEQTIERVAYKEFLGVIVDEKLNWHERVDTQCKKNH